MKFTLKFILILSLLICNISFCQEDVTFYSFQDRYGDITDGKPERDSLITLRNENGIRTGYGKMAMYESTLTDLKVGHWQEFNGNGHLESEGSYKLSSYLHCCAGGPCWQYYFYRTGTWKYYDKNENLLYELDFEPKKVHLDTSCEGGYELIFGLVNKIPGKYDKIVTTDTIVKRQKVKMQAPYGQTFMVALNGKIYWE